MLLLIDDYLINLEDFLGDAVSKLMRPKYCYVGFTNNIKREDLAQMKVVQFFHAKTQFDYTRYIISLKPKGKDVETISFFTEGAPTWGDFWISQTF